MRLQVCKEIASVHINSKTIASLQPNVSPGRYDLKLQANEIDFENLVNGLNPGVSVVRIV